MVGWHHLLNGHEFEQAPGDGEGQGSLGCCNPWGRKELERTEQLNSDNVPVDVDLLAEEVLSGCPSVKLLFVFPLSVLSSSEGITMSTLHSRGGC